MATIPPPTVHPSRPILMAGQTVLSKPETRTFDDAELKSNLPATEVWRKHPDGLCIVYIVLVVVMLTWPWVFFGYVAARDGIPASVSVARRVHTSAQDVAFVVTLLSNIFAGAIGYLFSVSVTLCAQKWVSSRGTKVSRIRFFANLKDHKPVWNSSPFGLVSLFYTVVFFIVTPGFAALLRPIRFNRQGVVGGSELDFSSTDPACINWFNRHTIPEAESGCGWVALPNGQNFSLTDCLGENQLVDVLDSGRMNMIYDVAGGINLETQTFTQLEGVHFLAPIHGVLPAGPDGIDVFNNVNLSTYNTQVFSYNYTLDLQGLTSNISCAYEQESPLVFTNETVNWSRYNGSCPSGQPFESYQVPTSRKSLGFGACAAPYSGPALGESYILYFRGDNDYAETVGNITCNVSSVQPAVFPVTYHSAEDRFTTLDYSSSTALETPTELTQRAISAIQDVVQESQGVVVNLVAEAVFGYLSAGYEILPNNAINQSEISLALWQSIVQGILQYQATYIRVIYTSSSLNSTDPPPPSCWRDISGNATYEMVGWKVTKKTAAYIIPLTIINMTSLIILLIAIFAGRQLPLFDPTDPVSLIAASSSGNVKVPHTSFGHPDDQDVLNVAVKYENIGPNRFALRDHH